MLLRRSVVALLACLALTACTSDDDPGGDEPDVPSPTAAAEALGSALASGDFSSVAFTSAEPQAVTDEYAATVAGLGDVTPTVTLAGVSDPTTVEPQATATFDWSWPIGPDGWSYQTEAPLSLLDDEWQVDWDVAAIEPSCTSR